MSSLDGGGTGGSETGTISWSFDPLNFLTADEFTFTFSDLVSGVEVDIFTLAGFAGSGFDMNAPYLLFFAGDDRTTGGNSDYLVWKGSVTAVPEPATLALLGVALAGLSFSRRKRR